MNYIKWKIEEIKKYILSTQKTEPTIPVKLSVEKITATTYAGETAYENEQFILLDIYPKTNGTVNVTYGGLTKTITDTSGATEPNAQQVFFGTFNGVSDNVETPSSGELIIEGDYSELAFTTGTYQSGSKSYNTGYYSGIKDVLEWGNISVIVSSAFYKCTSLTNITIPNSITSIGNYAFSECTNLTSVTFEENSQLTNIGDGAFYSCTSLTSIIIPSSVTSIGNRVFSGCTNLTSIIVDENNKSYDSRNNCNSIIETSANILISGCKNSFIPNSVTSIGKYAFENCTNLTSITIPNSVISIGSSAFEYCRSLTSIEIPNSVTSIGNGVFEECRNLTSITISNNVTSIGNRVFYYCKSLTSIEIPNSITSIGSDAFEYCTSLTSITIPSGVTSIKKYAFAGCTGLIKATFVNTSGWYVTETEGATSGTAMDVSDSANTVTLLTDTYRAYYWYRS